MRSLGVTGICLSLCLLLPDPTKADFYLPVGNPTSTKFVEAQDLERLDGTLPLDSDDVAKTLANKRVRVVIVNCEALPPNPKILTALGYGITVVLERPSTDWINALKLPIQPLGTSRNLILRLDAKGKLKVAEDLTGFGQIEIIDHPPSLKHLEELVAYEKALQKLQKTDRGAFNNVMLARSQERLSQLASAVDANDERSRAVPRNDDGADFFATHLDGIDESARAYTKLSNYGEIQRFSLPEMNSPSEKIVHMYYRVPGSQGATVRMDLVVQAVRTSGTITVVISPKGAGFNPGRGVYTKQAQGYFQERFDIVVQAYNKSRPWDGGLTLANHSPQVENSVNNYELNVGVDTGGPSFGYTKIYEIPDWSVQTVYRSDTDIGWVHKANIYGRDADAAVIRANLSPGIGGLILGNTVKPIYAVKPVPDLCKTAYRPHFAVELHRNLKGESDRNQYVRFRIICSMHLKKVWRHDSTTAKARTEVHRFQGLYRAGISW